MRIEQVLAAVHDSKLQQSAQLVRCLSEVVPATAWNDPELTSIQAQLGETLRHQIVQCGTRSLAEDLTSQKLVSCPPRYALMNHGDELPAKVKPNL